MTRPFLLLFIICTSFLFANEDISPLQKSLLKNKEDKGYKKASIQEDSWIGTINLSSSYDKSLDNSNENSSMKYSISLSQDVFKSGGIFYGILKGKNQKNLNEVQTKKNLNDINYKLYSTVLKIKKIDLRIKQQALAIQNKEIEVQTKQNKYINGVLGISDLNEAIIQYNTLKNSIEDLYTQKYDLINTLKIYSEKQYQSIHVEILSLINLKKYMNLNLQLQEQNLVKNDKMYDSKITLSNYLPKITINSAWNYNHNIDESIQNDQYNYGAQINLPLDYNSSKQVEVSKLEYIISSLKLKEEKIKEENAYNQYINKLKALNRKIKNKKESIKKYVELYEMTQSLYKNLLKTKDDVVVTKNRLESSHLELEVYRIEEQLVLYELYKKI